MPFIDYLNIGLQTRGPFLLRMRVVESTSQGTISVAYVHILLPLANECTDNVIEPC